MKYILIQATPEVRAILKEIASKKRKTMIETLEEIIHNEYNLINKK